MPYLHREYPRSLTALEGAFPRTAPLVLHTLGDVQCLHQTLRTVAIVGARACTPHARQLAWRLGHAAAQAGLIVLSGAARGIDQAAMQGALAGQGQVVGVLGSGLRQPYPTDAVPLLTELAEGSGCVVSEFADDLGPRPYHFPRRNRLLAGLSHAVLVVEAGKRSGSMNTATWAGQFGREIAACPGLAGSVAAQGNHELLRSGATFVEEVDDLLGVFDITVRNAAESSVTNDSSPCPVVHALQHEGLRFDDLVKRAEVSPDALQIRLSELELDGLVRQQSGGLYHLISH